MRQIIFEDLFGWRIISSTTLPIADEIIRYALNLCMLENYHILAFIVATTIRIGNFSIAKLFKLENLSN